jgi:hypothetical protein
MKPCRSLKVSCASSAPATPIKICRLGLRVHPIRDSLASRSILTKACPAWNTLIRVCPDRRQEFGRQSDPRTPFNQRRRVHRRA